MTKGQYTYKFYITLPDGIGPAVVITALKTIFHDVDFSTATDGTEIIDCRTLKDNLPK